MIKLKDENLRDYFAAKVLPGVYEAAMSEAASSKLFQDPDWRYYLAVDAYAIADAMLAAREKMLAARESKTIYCISINPDPEIGSVGGSDWRVNQQVAERLFQKMCASPEHKGDTLVRFNLQVPAMATPEQITETVDNAAWEQNYTEVNRVTVGG